MKYKILEKNKEFMIIDKPAGLLVHGGPHIREKSLADCLAENFPELKKVGEDPFRPGLVHRLDKLASGLLLVARTQKSFYNLKEQFQKRKIKKTYQALVFGQMPKTEDEIDFPIKRSRQGYKMAALPKTEKGEKNTKGRNASTSYMLIKQYINYSLLEIKIKTGRTHQIRVHMSAYGRPLVGDDIYGTKKTRIKNQKLDLGRIFLHCSRLEFSDLSGNLRSFKTGLTPELEDFLKKIK